MEIYNDRESSEGYRFLKTRELLGLLPLQSNTDERGEPLSPLLQLLVALRFYGAGALQTVTRVLVNVTQPTVCLVVGKVSKLVTQILFPKLVKFRDTTGCRTVMQEFY
ncbi:hypothetical protein HPB47_016657 [Ixodes persulcatus]|uniref:Uncharacterized protein n=1 Tax=Ixodes persulcatus TaxID=34615 RepID=A0AC60QQA6_IXOPE|nr:hypothetical protein HPB47_016657 [Ixodes persulcatus]